MAHILNIPEDVLDLIIRNMNMSSLTNLSKSCKYLRKFCDQDQYWQLRVKPEWTPVPELPNVTWKQFVIGVLSFGPSTFFQSA